MKRPVGVNARKQLPVTPVNVRLFEEDNREDTNEQESAQPTPGLARRVLQGERGDGFWLAGLNWI